MVRVFLLSPARASGARAGLLLREGADFPLAVKLRAGQAQLGECFAFASGLYFRGKLTYARAFARPHGQRPAVLVIAPGRGLVPAEEPLSIDALRAFGDVPVDEDEPRFRGPLEAHARELAAALPDDAQVVLLGSIASKKYVEPLLGVLGERLHFPREFVGRGDMSRGGLLLRCAKSGEELEYVPVAGAVVHGARPPRLPKLSANVSRPAPSRAPRATTADRAAPSRSPAPRRSTPRSRPRRPPGP